MAQTMTMEVSAGGCKIIVTESGPAIHMNLVLKLAIPELLQALLQANKQEHVVENPQAQPNIEAAQEPPVAKKEVTWDTELA